MLDIRFPRFTFVYLKLIDAFKSENDVADVNGEKQKGSLPIMLQKVEAYIFTDRVYAALQAAGVWFMTKHDEVLSKESDAAKVKEIIQITLAEIGIKGVVKTDKNVKSDVVNTVIVGDTKQRDVTNDHAETGGSDANLREANGEPKLSLIQRLKCHFEDDQVYNEWICTKVMPALA